MRMRYLAAPLCLAGLISSTAGALASPAEVLAAVNLRTGPGAQFYAIMVLPPGTPVEVYGCLNDQPWCDVGYGNTRGWLAARYLGAVRGWSPEQQIMRPPVFSPPPIYREPPVYANPPPTYREPAPEDAYPGDVYIEPPPVYVYRPPVNLGPPMPDLPQPDVDTYRARPQPQATPRVAKPAPQVASAPPATTEPTPASPSTTVTEPTTSTGTAPSSATAPSTTTSAQTVAPVAPSTTEAKPKYGSAVGKPGAPCKWVNGVCRND